MSEPLAEWRPSLAVFARRCLWLGGGTVLILGVPGLYLSIWQLALAAPVLIPIYVFLFDDHVRWLEVRQDRWLLFPDRLIHETGEGQSQIGLTDIVKATTLFGWTVTLHLTSGIKVQIPYVHGPRKIAAHIIAARNALTL